MGGHSKVGVLISGRGSNMVALIRSSLTEDSPYEIALVASDRPDALGLELARNLGVAAIGLPTPTRKDKSLYERALNQQLRTAGVEVIALAGYMHILSPEFVELWEGRIVNIHPSLLPLYKGLHTHARAIAAGDAKAGCSVHLVTAGLDEGPVLAQAEVPILPGDTPDTLAARVLIEEHRLYPRALAALVRTL